MDDKRRFPRWTITDKVFYKKEGEQEAHEGLSKNICNSGTCISLPEAVAPNTQLDLTIHVGGGFMPISTSGKVRWVSASMDSKNNPFLAGISFDFLGDLDRDKIFNYAYNYRRDEITKRWWQGA